MSASGLQIDDTVPGTGAEARAGQPVIVHYTGWLHDPAAPQGRGAKFDSSKDRGDVAGLRHMGERVVIECKSTARPDLAGWAAEAETERGNDEAVAGLICHKRHGKGQPADQWVTCTLGELVALITGSRQHLEDQ